MTDTITRAEHEAALAKAVAAENEACAALSNDRWKQWTDENNVSCDASACEEIATAIRSRMKDKTNG